MQMIQDVEQISRCDLFKQVEIQLKTKTKSQKRVFFFKWKQVK